MANVVTLLLMAVCLLAASCNRNDKDRVILDVKEIVNKNAQEVEGMLGKPDSVYTLQIMGKSIFCQLYLDKRVEIQYPESFATDIVVRELRGLSFDQTALSAFNLDFRQQHPSDYKRGSLIRWNDFDEFSAISFYNTERDSLNNVVMFDIFFKSSGPGKTN